VGGDEVDRASHEVHPHDLPADEQVREHRRIEHAQPRPEPRRTLAMDAFAGGDIVVIVAGASPHAVGVTDLLRVHRLGGVA
jgi:hypothetical protein